MERNVVKTTVLLGAIGGLLVTLGMLFGGLTGAVIGLLLGIGVCGVSYWRSDAIAIRSAGAVPAPETTFARLHEVVREVAERAGVPKPRVYIIDEAQPNAFATGRGPRTAVVAVTRGLLEVTTRDELRGVIAHEIAHIRNRDILIGSVAAAIATGISFLANLVMFTGIVGGDDEDRPHPLVALVVAPVAAGILQSTRRTGRAPRSWVTPNRWPVPSRSWTPSPGGSPPTSPRRRPVRTSSTPSLERRTG